MCSAGGRSSDSGLPPHRLPGRGGQWHFGEEHLPSQRRDRPGLAPGSLSVRRFCGGPYHRAVTASRALNAWLPVIAWAAAIFALSSVPSLSSGLGTWDFVLRKAAHLTEYAVLGGLLARAVADSPALVLGIAYAVTDEVHQTYVAGRAGSLRDVAIDSVGVLAGIVAVRRVSR
jgi:hypothetical protein